MKAVGEILSTVSDFVWGAPLMLLLVGTGVLLTLRLKGVQFRTLCHSLYLALIKRKESGAEGDISHFQALMTALAATVGTGNIAGVATAIAAGGPGALFWMWITGLFGMATKYGEAVLAVKYRVKDEFGTMSGGPMYYLSRGLKAPWLGVIFAVFASVAAFGIGNMTQSNSIADAIGEVFSIPHWATGLIIMFFVMAVILGGIRQIGRVTGVLVPFMIIFYISAAVIVIILKFDSIPHVFGLIFKQAFSPTAATGGFLGSTVMYTIRMGVARGVFSNESGLGSAPIAAAAAQTKEPVSQAMVSMTQTFIDTLVVCTLTGFVIISSGVWKGSLDGAQMTARAFSDSLGVSLFGYPLGGLIVSVGLLLFAFSTILGWSYYGEKSIEYLFGERVVLPYRLIFSLVILPGAVFKIQVVWSFSDIMNALMALPNLVGLILLSGVIARETRKYFERFPLKRRFFKES
jgi:AGCS family alanine or glycine:cation symporter